MMGLTKSKKLAGTLAFVAGLFCASHLAFALSIEPLIVEMSTAGSGARTTLQIENPTAQQVPMEFHVRRIKLDRDGKVVDLGQADNNFLIIPDQPLLQPNTVQAIRVQWVGDIELSESQTYIIVAEQLPVVALDARQSGIQVVMNFSIIVNVAPPGSAGALEVVGTDVAPVNGKRLARVTLRNTGNRHIILGDGSVTLSSESWSVDLNKTSLRQTMGLGLLPPGTERVFVLGAEVPNSVTRYRAEFSGLNTN
jgi:fimbrial chaperone protein